MHKLNIINTVKKKIQKLEIQTHNLSRLLKNQLDYTVHAVLFDIHFWYPFLIH